MNGAVPEVTEQAIFGCGPQTAATETFIRTLVKGMTTGVTCSVASLYSAFAAD